MLRVHLLDEVEAATELPRTLADSERDLILRALERARWHIKGPQGAAAQLGLNPSTLYGRMKKLGIRPPGPAEDSSAVADQIPTRGRYVVPVARPGSPSNGASSAPIITPQVS